MEYLRIGLDAGSTTVKIAVLDGKGQLVFSKYVRHGYHVPETVRSVLEEAAETFPGAMASIAMTGAGVLEETYRWGVPFVQELSAEALALERLAGGVDVSIELGGEDAKVTYFHAGKAPDQRMNRSCAGGTGAFLDHLAAFLGTDAAGLDRLAAKGSRIYPIASRCGVYAKTDVQGLLNEGARKEDIALSVFQAIVNQVLSGLARGCPIRGRVAFLGGPFTYMPALLARFRSTLHLEEQQVVSRRDGALFAAIGAALSVEDEPRPLADMVRKMLSFPGNVERDLILPPLFKSEAEYQDFQRRHARAKVRRGELSSHTGALWLGIDAGSTTMKAVLIDASGAVLASWYGRHGGDVLAAGKRFISQMYQALPRRVYLAGAGITGYGEGLLKTAFHIDVGEVETIAHLRAARFFCPDLTALLDIGGQDMKYIRVEDGVISRIALNSSCASGCGLFLETFGETLHLDIHAFADKAIHAPYLLDLGYHCTVLMNSKVRQVQRHSVDTGALAAGLCMAVVKNALYRVVQLSAPSDMGGRIVAEGGTFWNDAVLRALEQLTGCEVIRPDMAGFMGAYGMALIALERRKASEKSHLISPEEVQTLTAAVRHQRCGGCGNRCLVTAYQFSAGSLFVTGNRCDRGGLLMRGRRETKKGNVPANGYAWMRDHLLRVPPVEGTRQGCVGIPMTLSMWEDFPYWAAFFSALGYRVIPSHFDARGMGDTAATIPEGIFCEACRLSHVHLWQLIQEKPDWIWMPVLPRGGEEPEIDEWRHASYGDALDEAMKAQLADAGIPFLHPHLPLLGTAEMEEKLADLFPDIPGADIQRAVQKAGAAQISYYETLRDETERVLREVRQSGRTAVILCGRNYQTDPQVNKGIPHLLTELGVPVLAAEGALLLGKSGRDLLAAGNTTLRERVLAAIHLAETVPSLQYIQLHSVSCGYDSLTLQESEKRLARVGKIHTVVSLDQGMNIGAIRIRLRSLLAEIMELAAHPEAVEKLRQSAIPADEEIRRIWLPPLDPLYDPLLAAAFSTNGIEAETLPKGALELAAPYVTEETGAAATAAIAACLQKWKQGDMSGKGQAVILLSSARDAAAAQQSLKQVPVRYFDAGRRGGTLPITLDGLHRFFCALFLGDVLLRVKLAAGQEMGKDFCRRWMPICLEAVKDGSFQGYTCALTEMEKAAAALPIRRREFCIGIEGNPFVYLPALEKMGSFLAGEGGEILASGLGEWYANELREVYQGSHFNGSRKEAEVCLAARNTADVYLRAFSKTMATAPALSGAEEETLKRKPGKPLGDEKGTHLSWQQRILLLRGADGILQVKELSGFEGDQKIGGKGGTLSIPYLVLEQFSGDNWIHGKNRIRMLVDAIRETRE